MRLIGLRIALALSLALAPLAVEAQRAGKVYRIGFLGPAAERVYTDSLLSLRTGLRELGYVKGKNIVFEYRFAEDKYERLPGLAPTPEGANAWRFEGQADFTRTVHRGSPDGPPLASRAP